ncbi:MAG: hypothetical protein ACKOGP_06655, partial [Bacteroidota bacterium]
MLRTFPFACLFCVLPIQLLAQYNTSVLPLSAGAGSVFHNPAMTAHGDSAFEVFFHHRSPLMLKPLAESMFGTAFRITNHNYISIGLRYSGYSLYNRTSGVLALANRLTPSLTAAVRFDVHHIAQGGDYGNASSWTGSCGVYWSLTKSLSAGVSIQNPTRNKLGDSRTNALTISTIQWSINNKSSLWLGASKEGPNPMSYQIRIDYLPVDALLLQAGLSSGF